MPVPAAASLPIQAPRGTPPGTPLMERFNLSPFDNETGTPSPSLFHYDFPVEHRAGYRLVNDPDKPSWDDKAQDDDEGYRLFGTRIREAIKLLSGGV